MQTVDVEERFLTLSEDVKEFVFGFVDVLMSHVWNFSDCSVARLPNGKATKRPHF